MLVVLKCLFLRVVEDTLSFERETRVRALALRVSMESTFLLSWEGKGKRQATEVRGRGGVPSPCPPRPLVVAALDHGGPSGLHNPLINP